MTWVRNDDGDGIREVRVNTLEGTPGALHRDAGAGATHGDPHVGGGQGGGIIDAVAGPRHYRPLGPERLDPLAILLGEYLGADLVDPQPPRHGLGLWAAIARDPDDPQALLGEQLLTAAESLIGSAILRSPARRLPYRRRGSLPDRFPGSDLSALGVGRSEVVGPPWNTGSANPASVHIRKSDRPHTAPRI
jgi:hypothetical protein